MQITLLTIIGRWLFNLAEYVKVWGLVWLDRLLGWHLIDAHESVSKMSENGGNRGCMESQ